MLIDDNGILVQDTTNMGPIDTLGGDKVAKPKKPFRSYLFADSVKKTTIFKWNINLDDATIKISDIDTTLNKFEKNYPFMKNHSVGAASIGTLGGAAIPFNYSSRYNSYSNSFSNPYGDYFFNPENVPFYNVKKPFTQFEYMTAGQKQYAEERLFVNHAQNISPSTSLDIYYQYSRKRGSYGNQQATNKNLSINFAHTGRQYTVFMGYIYNIANIVENGGIKDIGNIIDTTITEIPESAIPVNIKASNKISGNQLYLTQSVIIPLTGQKIDSTTNFNLIPTLSLGMSVNYSAYKKMYLDKKSNTGDFYENWYLNKTTTRDSINEKNTDLKFFFKYQPYNTYGEIGTITAGLGYSNEKYYNFNPKQFIVNSYAVEKENLYVYSSMNGGYYQFLRWNIYAKYYPTGHRSQDVKIGGNINLLFGKTKMPFKATLAAKFAAETPSYWAQNYVSNHFIWHNNFSKEINTQFDFNFRMDKINLEIGVTQSIDKNKIFYNEKSTPEQYLGTVSVTSLFLKKDFKWKGLNLQHRVNLQLSSNQQVAPVPLVAANITYFYDIPVVKNVLNIHIGIDAYYNTKFNGFGYNPAVGQFYHQSAIKLGNYPMFDVFAVGKWKKLRFILKVQHVNFDWYENNRNYIQVVDHPLNRLMFTFGFSWNFYD